MIDLVTILGPTASGKTSLAVALAYRLDSEIISADSRQVYRGMDIGTGKDLDEYVWEGKKIPYHLIDIVEAGYKYNVFEYQSDFVKVWEDCRQRGVLPVLCGGSGLYVEAVLKGYKLLAVPVDEDLRASLAGLSLPELAARLATYKKLHNTTDTDTCKRAIRAIEIEEYYSCHLPDKPEDKPVNNALIIGVDISRELRRERISQRLRSRLDEGMVEEVRTLLNSGIAPEDLIYYGLEYKYLTEYVIGRLSYGEMVSLLEIAIHQFAKRQMTWFRGMERRGFDIYWLDVLLPIEEKLDLIQSKIKKMNEQL